MKTLPWKSGLRKKHRETYEDHIEMHSGSGHDCRVLEFLAAFTKFQKEQIDKEHSAYLKFEENEARLEEMGIPAMVGG